MSTWSISDTYKPQIHYLSKKTDTEVTTILSKIRSKHYFPFGGGCQFFKKPVGLWFTSLVLLKVAILQENYILKKLFSKYVVL